MGARRTNIRYGETGWELLCPDCLSRGHDSAFWPLTLEFWRPDHGMTRCRACWNTVRRERWARASARDRAKRNAANRQRRYRAKVRAFRAVVHGMSTTSERVCGLVPARPSTRTLEPPRGGGTLAA